jgi:hypothetical protein
MKSHSVAVVARVLGALFFASIAHAQSDAHRAYDQLKALEGNWTGTNSEGKSLNITFRMTGGGTLMSEIHAHGPQNMITMFYMDNDRLLMTHYCGAGNQPRMKASASADGKTVTFDFIDATNLPSLEDGHMQRLVISMPDTNHHLEEWIFVDHGKETKEIFDVHRS